MGCFLKCFGFIKDRKRRKLRNKIIPSQDQINENQNPLQTTAVQEQEITENPTSYVSELIDKLEEQLSPSTRKTVEFDSNLKNFEHISLQESTDSLFIEKENPTKSNESNTQSEDDSITSSFRSYPLNHRYQNYQDSDNETEELYDSDLNENDDWVEEQEDCSDCDEHIDSQIVWSEPIPNEEPKPIQATNPNVRDRHVNFHPVLDPIENLTQWKAMEFKGTLPLKPNKENFGEEQGGLPLFPFSSEPTFKHSLCSLKSKSHQPKNPNQEISVDASLSSWLVSTQTSKKSMSQSIEDRPILGALTLEELRAFSVSNTPRKSPSRRLDELPIIGTVGTYWNHTASGCSYKGKNMKYI